MGLFADLRVVSMGKAYKSSKYYSITKPTFNFWESLYYVLKSPLLLISWVVSFFLARNVTNLALNPSNIKIQNFIHVVRLSEDPSENSTLVVNVLPHESHKALRDYGFKFGSSLFGSSYLSGENKPRLVFENSEDLAHIDYVIEEIGLLIKGNSTQQKCQNKKFNWEDIQLKGLEGLDNKLHAYFLEQLYKKYTRAEVTKPRRMNSHFFTLETRDSLLDSVEIAAQDELSKPMSERKFIVACMARDQNYINWMKDFNTTANKVGCSVIGFNYRGVCYSKGMVWTQDNMINDALGQVERLLELGAKPENIGLEGMCLGGAVATLTAAQLNDRGLGVKLYNERSFRSLPHLIIGQVMPGSGSSLWHPMTWMRYLAVGLIYLILKPLLWLVSWKMDAEAAWDRIPEANKDLSVIHDTTNLDLQSQEEDGVIEYSYASLASHVEEQKDRLIDKLQQDDVIDLTNDEQVLLDKIADNNNFKSNPDFVVPGKPGHLLPRRHLVDIQGNNETIHDHMMNSFIQKFKSVTKPAMQLQKREDDSQILAPSRPLFIASSGGGGHISAMTGIIAAKTAQDADAFITKHQAQLYRDRPSSVLNYLIRTGVYTMSTPVLDYGLSELFKLFKVPRMPDYNEFWLEMEKLEKAEIEVGSQPPVGRLRPYVDMLLDVYPRGYESVSINNTLHRMEKLEDVRLLINYKNMAEQPQYPIVYNHFLTMLKEAADSGQPYTEVISSQPLSLAALCDAVRDYNKYVEIQNDKWVLQIPKVAVHQYLTDLPTLGCDHFLSSLETLTPEQQQQMHLYAVNFDSNIGAAITDSYLNGGLHFQGVHSVKADANPMIRPGFKAANLGDFQDRNRDCTVQIKAYTNQGPGNWVLQENKQAVEIPAGDKVASIMLGSVPSDATVTYVQHLLNDVPGYDKIFVFGGLNASIYASLERLVNSYPESQRAGINARIIRLGNQSDHEMAPIMTRSDCVVIRGGGLSVMEQMAMPKNPHKIFFIHHNDRDDENLTSGLSWEDGNVDSLLDYFAAHDIYAKKTSPQLVKEMLKNAPKFPLVNDIEETEVGAVQDNRSGNKQKPAGFSWGSVFSFFTPKISQDLREVENSYQVRAC